MNSETLKQSIEEHASFSFARSGGPGGQNVNKVNTKVLLSIYLTDLSGLSETEQALVATRLSTRINPEGIFSLSVDEERSQYRNRIIALERAFSLISRACNIDKKRVPTKPSKASKLRRLQAKSSRSNIKQNRTRPAQE